jgi:flagellar biosynthesis/type III secretory pathway M-ring protein FliF/YscJ
MPTTAIVVKMSDLIVPAMIVGATMAFLFMVLFIGLDGLQARLEQRKKSRIEEREYRRETKQRRRVEPQDDDDYESPRTERPVRQVERPIERQAPTERPYKPGKRAERTPERSPRDERPEDDPDA